MAEDQSSLGARLFSMFEGALPSIFVAGGILALLLLAGVLGWIVVVAQSSSETFNFIALVIIFMAAVTLAAAVFVGLKLGNPLEAFGLPAGSMRALLAIGVMILFVVFGLPMVSSQGSDRIEARDGTVPAAQLPAAIQLHREQGLRVRVIDYGADPVPAAGTTLARPARPATYQTFGRADLRSPEEIDFGKQVLTAVITLLTSVVSFYFGSRSATDVVARSQSGGGTASAAPTDLTALRKQLQASVAALNSDLLAAGAKIHALQSDPSTATTTARTTALAEAGSLRQTAEGLASTVAGHLAAANTALAAAATATHEDERQRHEAMARERLQQGTSLISEARQAQRAYSAKVQTIQ